MRSRTAKWLLGIVMVLILFALARTVVEGGALGHDESAYALEARAWIAGTPDTGWSLHRAPLLSALAVPIVAITESEVALRGLAVTLAIGALLTMAAFAWRVGGAWTALLAVATVGGSLAFLRRGSELLTDVAAAGMLLGIVCIVVTVLRDPNRHARLALMLGPLVALAFYMRYQSALAIVAIAVATVVVAPGTVAALRRPLLISVGVTVVLIAPHLVWANAVTGSPWGVVAATGDAAGRAYVGEGLTDYVSLFPLDLAGPAGAGLMVIGVVWGVVTLWVGAREGTFEARLAGFTLIVAALTVVPLGLVAHGEPRFVFFPVWLLIAIGAMAVVRIVEHLGRWLPTVVLTLAIVLWVPLFLLMATRADRNAEARGSGFSIVTEAAELIEQDAAGSCGVVTSYLPQVTWYSACFTHQFTPDSPATELDDVDGDSRYVLFFENGKRQPAPGERQAYLELGPVEEIESSDDSIGDATIVDVIEETGA